MVAIPSLFFGPLLSARSVIASLWLVMRTKRLSKASACQPLLNSHELQVPVGLGHAASGTSVRNSSALFRGLAGIALTDQR
jgi:hypothetical protein